LINDLLTCFSFAPSTTVLAEAESPEELLITLTTASTTLNHFDTEMHDLELQTGVAHALIRMLERTLIFQHKNGQKYYRNCLGQARALRLAVLCSALEMVFRCSSETLKEHLNQGGLKTLVDGSLLGSFSKIIEIFLSWEGQSTVRNIALSKSTRVIHLIASHSALFPDKIVASLFAMLNASVTSDIRVDVSCAIAVLSVHSKNKFGVQFLKPFARVSSNLISTLTTASACLLDHPSRDVINAMFNLASGSSELRAKMSKRRDTIQVIVALMARSQTRCTAMRIALLLLSCEESLVQLQNTHSVNGTYLLDGLARMAGVGSDEKNERLAVLILASIMVDHRWNDGQLVRVVHALNQVVHSSKIMDLQIKAGSALCKKLSVSGRTSKLSGIIAEKVTCLITFPNEAIQVEALSASSKRMATGHDVELLLLENETFQLSISEVIRHGARSTQRIVFSLLEKCTRNVGNRELICRCPILLEAIVDYVVDSKISKRTTYVKAVGVILALMVDEVNIKHFQQFQELLPWLSSLANATGDNIALKTNLIGAIIRLSTCHLQLY
jgi:hypothetical protein